MAVGGDNELSLLTCILTTACWGTCAFYSKLQVPFDYRSLKRRPLDPDLIPGRVDPLDNDWKPWRFSRPFNM